jgi:hypothetical protein
VNAAANSLQNRASGPSQTPTIRRTGSLPPLVEAEPPKKTGPFATVLAAVFLLLVIVYGGMRLRPELEAAHKLNESAQADAPKAAAAKPVEPTQSAPVDLQLSTPSAPVTNDPPPEITPAVETSKTTSKASSTPVPTPAVAKTVEPPVNTAASNYQHQIEKVLSERNWTDRVNVRSVSSTVTLTGKLRTSEHADLLKFMRNAPSSVRVVDDIQYDDSPLATTGGAAKPPVDNGTHPVPSPGSAAIHVVTDVIGATATLYGNGGHPIFSCLTPCSFNDLVPAGYSLQIQKEGYLTIQTALETKMGQTSDQKFHLEGLARGLYVSSRPPGADIFINGAKQSGQTPVTLPLAPGQYDLVLRLSGYEGYSSHVQVKDGAQTTLDAELNEKQSTSGHVAWAQVNSTPAGAKIFVDGNDSGQVTPSRIQIPSGIHIIQLRLDGYQQARQAVEASDGGTVPVTETLHPTK